MGKKKKKRVSRGMGAISPIDKRGIKLGTLLVEIGLGSEIVNQHKASGGDLGRTLSETGKAILDPGSHSSTAIMWAGVMIAVAGKFVPQLKYMGPIGFR
jgi:hypothetical protein